MWKPNQPHFEGEEYVEEYETVSTNPEDFEGQSVLILGQFCYCSTRYLLASLSVTNFADIKLVSSRNCLLKLLTGRSE